MLGPLDLIVPPVVLLTAVATLPFTLISHLVTGNISDLTSWPKLRHAWFKHFWWWFGPGSKPLFAASVRPLLAQASGTVLDIGPASGIWMPEFGEAVKNNPGKIKKIYGIEPNTLFHPQLLSQAKANGLEGIYEPVAAYAQDLEGKGIEKGSVDTVITVHVLCSVGDHAETIVKELYEYLKPGGQWLVFEHVASRNAPIKVFQSMCRLGAEVRNLLIKFCRHQQHCLAYPTRRLCSRPQHGVHYQECWSVGHCCHWPGPKRWLL